LHPLTHLETTHIQIPSFNDAKWPTGQVGKPSLSEGYFAMQEEIWLPIVGYEGLYSVSNLGNIKRVERIKFTKNGRMWKLKERPCVIWDNSHGYMTASLHKESVTKTKTVHRIVAIAFLSNEENKKCVNHKNEIRNDNRVDNLEWCTYSENSKHAFDVLKRDRRIGKGMGGDNARSVSIKCVQTDKVFSSIRDAVREMNIPITTIYSAISRQRMTREGYSFIRLDKQ